MDKKQSASTYDVRVVQRHIGDGSISAADYKSFLEKLPDVASKAEPVQTSLVAAEDDVDDDAHDEG
jgi:hypothetical protein